LAPAAVAARLSTSAGAIRALLTGVTEEQARWKPEPRQWSMLEVINHLADEEAEDFRRRVEYVLTRPGESWPTIDPTGWASARKYLERALDESIARFRAERERSVEWLSGLTAADLDAAYPHPSLGAIRAGDLLGAWLAHDLIHVRQLTRLHYRWLERGAAPYKLDYAGSF
jgi:hypothetical protein